jgi:hypothetical protein
MTPAIQDLVEICVKLVEGKTSDTGGGGGEQSVGERSFGPPSATEVSSRAEEAMV